MENIKLLYGSHSKREDGMCLLEAVAFVAGEPHSDRPRCTDVVLGAFGRAVNDWMTEDERELLVSIVPKLIGTAGDHTLSLRRAMLICDGVVRQILPIAMDGVGLTEHATKLRSLSEIKDESSASAAKSAAKSAASAAWSAASAAWSAESAESAAKSAAWSAESAESAARKNVVDALLAIFNAAIEVK